MLGVWFPVFQPVARDLEVDVPGWAWPGLDLPLTLAQAGVQRGEDPAQHGQDQEHWQQLVIYSPARTVLTYDKKSVHMYCGVWSGFHFFEYCQGRLVVRSKLQHVTEVQSRLLEMPVSLQYLTQLKHEIS